MVGKYCKELKFVVSYLMCSWVSEAKLSEDEQMLYLLRNQVNHNTISPSLLNKITNNFFGNPIEADLNDKVQMQDLDDTTCYC